MAFVAIHRNSCLYLVGRYLEYAIEVSLSRVYEFESQPLHDGTDFPRGESAADGASVDALYTTAASLEMSDEPKIGRLFW